MSQIYHTVLPAIQWAMTNPLTRRIELIDLEVAELLPGQTVMKLFRANDRYVTIPGDCTYRVTETLELVLSE